MIVVKIEDLDEAHTIIAQCGVNLMDIEVSEDHLPGQKQIHFDYSGDEDHVAAVLSASAIDHTLRFR